MEEEIIQNAEEEKEGSNSSEEKEQKMEEEKEGSHSSEEIMKKGEEEKEESESEFEEDDDSSDEEGGYHSNSDMDEDEVEDIYVKEEEESESEFEVYDDSSDEEGGYDSNSDMDEDELEDMKDLPHILKIRKSTKIKKPISYDEFLIIQETINAFCVNQMSLGEEVPYLKVIYWDYDLESKAGYVACVDEATREWIRNYLQNTVICGKKYQAWRMDKHDKILIKVNINIASTAYFKKADCFMKYVIASEKEKIPQTSKFEICESKKLGTKWIQHRYIINEEFFYALQQLDFTTYFGTLKFRFRCIYY
jgi:hypothetical protein